MTKTKIVKHKYGISSYALKPRDYLVASLACFLFFFTVWFGTVSGGTRFSFYLSSLQDTD